MAEIRLSNVTKKFGDVTAVNNINLVAQDKEFLALVGPSGCGKTTTLRMIAGLEEPTEGDIYIEERKVNNVAPKDRDIAMVFQNYALYPHMNVYKNMSFGLRLRKFPKEEIDQRVNEGAKMLGIEELLGRKPKELSGGQRQRVAMGRAIVRKPKVFLFDEPLSNLDAKLRVAMRGELAKLHERLETTIVYVTHDQVEAMTLASRIVVMNQGHIMQIGTPLEVYNNPKNLFVAGFIGSPAMNFLDARVVEDNGVLVVQGEGFKLPIPKHLYERFGKAKDQEVILGIRPEHIYDKEIKGPFPGGEVLKATVDVFEPLGSEVILQAACGPYEITACVDPRTRARVHDDVEFLVDMNLIHLFNKETEYVY
ncbi:MAG: sn-glycerol-3-phosphate ABC transporter ATP-binding protein UgpC [Deltaproteobacteria bacterium]|nr:sn-glycerol-3-phosphate ABC transporter ATP-binding protein UgpC [Deltaproteobacteria bacterium]MBW2123760.1 sn-glycerol-3-phosphate ABC transporter ATP-binding protein UgpC [Deltaproteobacteria bacterium]